MRAFYMSANIFNPNRKAINLTIPCTRNTDAAPVLKGDAAVDAAVVADRVTISEVEEC
jgi:hypothetical protein